MTSSGDLQRALRQMGYVNSLAVDRDGDAEHLRIDVEGGPVNVPVSRLGHVLVAANELALSRERVGAIAAALLLRGEGPSAPTGVAETVEDELRERGRGEAATLLRAATETVDVLRAVLTGSRAYGEPRDASDVDLAVLVSPGDADALRALADRNGAEVLPPSAGEDAETTSLRFGRLNLIVSTDPLAHAVWVVGTARLRHQRQLTRSVVTRDRAVETFRALRREVGLEVEELEEGEL